jgi:hypothetical protein
MPWRSDAAAEVEVTGALAAGDSAMAGSGEAAFLVASQVEVVWLAALPPPGLSVRLTALPGAALLAVALGRAFVVTASPASACRSALA